MSDERVKVYSKKVVNTVRTGGSLIIFIISLSSSIIFPFITYKLQELKYFNIEPDKLFIINFTCAAAVLIVSIILFFIGTMKKFHDFILRNHLTELNNLSAKLNSNISVSKEMIKNIENSKYYMDNPKIINDDEMFFKYLNRAQNNIDSGSIRLTNFSKMLINDEECGRDGINNINDYFNKILKTYKEKTNKIAVYNIVSIHTLEKLNECKRLVEKANAMKLANFHLAYLYIEEDFENNLPNVIGVQIIGDEVLLMHPQFARLSNNADNEKAIHIKSKVIADMYKNYYKLLWNEIKVNKKRGFLLYDGEKRNTSINKYWTEIENDVNIYNGKQKSCEKEYQKGKKI
ncbi:MAG: hypothetical protein FWD28_05615 [Treponema sp.]|nr:hypothetical protein [Treponema sp.]